MSNSSPPEGSRLGPYLLNRRLPDAALELGWVYEAIHVETGAPSLVLVPEDSSDWGPRAPWTVRSRGSVSPPFVGVEVERTPGAGLAALHALTLLSIQVSGVLASVEDREDMAAFLARGPRLPAPPVARWRARSLPLAVLCVLVLGLGLWFWPRASVLPRQASDESVDWIDLTEPAGPISSYPLPSEPIKGQHKPPCIEGTEVEINGGCWVQLKHDAPCPRNTAQHQGRCYMPVREPAPVPRSVEPGQGATPR